MVDVAGVRFKNIGKIYYFDPGDFELKPGCGVIVETARGMEFGTVTMGRTAVNDSDVKKPLKKIIRIANENDVKRHTDNENKKSEAIRRCQEKIKEHGLDMKLIDVQYTFDSNKVIFYFTAEGRVDFRELVKDLASLFKMRIELRQIGVRDEARMLGGVGSCGKGLCCASWLSDFQPVSIKMAKVQNLSLTPTKISGVCGRLMCCLKYENDVYVELRKDVPEINEKVETREGVGKVVEADILQGRIKVRLYTGEFDENGLEKLGYELLTFSKDDVKRLEKKDRAKREKAARNSGNSLLDKAGVFSRTREGRIVKSPPGISGEKLRTNQEAGLSEQVLDFANAERTSAAEEISPATRRKTGKPAGKKSLKTGDRRSGKKRKSKRSRKKKDGERADGTQN